MTYRITVQQGLAAHFKQAAGPSRLGVDWMIKIEGPKNGVVIVRTYLMAAGANEEQKALLSQRAIDFIQRKLESGWDPATRTGILEIGNEPDASIDQN